jgi:KWG Leptospira.
MIGGTMTRILLLCCLCLSLLSFTAFAETPATDIALFPARAENGLWGYIDSQGTWVIEPQFNYAYGFRGNYAEVTIVPGRLCAR